MSGVNVVDVINSKVLEDMTLKIKNGKITSIAKSSLADLQEANYTSFHMSGMYLCPGLIDCECPLETAAESQATITPRRVSGIVWLGAARRDLGARPR